MKGLMEFLEMRRRNLQIIRDQLPWNNLVKDKDEASKILRGRSNEIERIIRKLKKVGIEAMIEKESKSYTLNKTKKDNMVHNLNQTGSSE